MTETGVEPENKPEDAPSLYSFVGWVFLWLIPCFVVWVSLSSLLAAPAVWLADLILTNGFPDFVHEFSLNGPQALLATNFGDLDGKIVSAEAAGYRLAYPLNTRIISYSVPFYAALHFATQTTSSSSNKSFPTLIKGLLLLYGLMVVGLISISVKNLMLGLGPVFMDATGTGAAAVGLMYQFSTLMIPPLAPVLIWAWQSKTNPLLRQLLENTTGIGR